MPGRKTHPEIAQVRDLAGWDICGGGPVYSGSDGAEVVFPDGDDGDMRAVQFMYLYRRFGYQIHGGDPHKSLADYFLSTPDPDVVLWCKPGSSLRWSFGVGISPALAEQAYIAKMQWRRSKNRNPEQWEDHPIYVRIHTAICAAMTELLRPVYIRDVDYNILGRVPGDAPYGRWNAAEHSPQSGYGLGDFDPAKAYA